MCLQPDVGNYGDIRSTSTNSRGSETFHIHEAAQVSQPETDEVKAAMQGRSQEYQYDSS